MRSIYKSSSNMSAPCLTSDFFGPSSLFFFFWQNLWKRCRYLKNVNNQWPQITPLTRPCTNKSLANMPSPCVTTTAVRCILGQDIDTVCNRDPSHIFQKWLHRGFDRGSGIWFSGQRWQPEWRPKYPTWRSTYQRSGKQKGNTIALPFNGNTITTTITITNH